MVAPITGPFSQTVIANGPPHYYGFVPRWLERTRTWSRQRKPYNLPLDFSLVHRQVLSNSNPLWYPANIASEAVPSDSGTLASAHNRAYAKFRESCYSSASVAVSLAERKQAMGMVASRAIQLVRFTSALKKLRFDQAVRELGVNRLPRHLSTRSGPKALANNWLEFHFGWRPLIKDVFDACDVLQSEIPLESISGSGSASTSVSTATDANGVTRHFNVTSRVRIQAKVRFDNPNLGLATQLGLTNPAVVAWELVPFSFVVDWFVNVGDFLQSFTDFAGFTIVDPQRYNKVLISENRTCRPPGVVADVRYRYATASRIPGSIPGPSLRVRDRLLPSPTRAVTSIALLLQFLPQKR